MPLSGPSRIIHRLPRHDQRGSITKSCAVMLVRTAPASPPRKDIPGKGKSTSHSVSKSVGGGQHFRRLTDTPVLVTSLNSLWPLRCVCAASTKVNVFILCLGLHVGLVAALGMPEQHRWAARRIIWRGLAFAKMQGKQGKVTVEAGLAGAACHCGRACQSSSASQQCQ